MLLGSPAPCPSPLPRFAAASPRHLGLIRRPQNRLRRCEECMAERLGEAGRWKGGDEVGRTVVPPCSQGFLPFLPPSITQLPPLPCPVVPAAPSFPLEPAPRSRLPSPSRAELGFWLSLFTDFPLLLPRHPPTSPQKPYLAAAHRHDARTRGTGLEIILARIVLCQQDPWDHRGCGIPW